MKIVRPGIWCMVLVLIGALLVPGAAQTTVPTTAPSGRTPQVVLGEADAAMQQFGDAIGHGLAFLTPEARKAAGPAVRPIVATALARMRELRGMQPQLADMLTPTINEFQAFAVIFGDEKAKAALQQAAAGSDSAAATARAILAAADYMCATDVPGKMNAIDAYGAAIRSAPDNTDVIPLLIVFRLVAEPSNDVREHLFAALRENSQDPQVQQLAEMLEADNRLHLLENKPLVVEGLDLDGSQFSTAQWKGKVILVDFWATWCVPCQIMLPRVKKMYADYHDKGLEVLGVSSDQRGDALRKFLAENPDMPWPELFDPTAPGWHPLTMQYGIRGIPTMFLIDRKGILRSVSGVENMDDLVPTLLAEKAK